MADRMNRVPIGHVHYRRIEVAGRIPYIGEKRFKTLTALLQRVALCKQRLEGLFVHFVCYLNLHARELAFEKRVHHSQNLGGAVRVVNARAEL
jgi:hypothetical protein